MIYCGILVNHLSVYKYESYINGASLDFFSASKNLWINLNELVQLGVRVPIPEERPFGVLFGVTLQANIPRVRDIMTGWTDAQSARAGDVIKECFANRRLASKQPMPYTLVDKSEDNI